MLNIAVLLEVENMTFVTAIQVLFGETVPAGANFEEAFNALKGKKDTDLLQADVTILDELAEIFQDFVGDPAGWLKKASASDPRHSRWVQLAQALGASVTSSVTPATATSPSTSGSAASAAPADAPTPDIEPEQGIDPDTLAGGAPPPRRDGGGRFSVGGVAVRTDDGDRRESLERKLPASQIHRAVAPRIIAILETGTFQQHRRKILKLFGAIREGNTSAQGKLDALEVNLRRIVRAMPTGYLVMASAELALDMIQSLRAGKDQSEPGWFRANYVTGTYTTTNQSTRDSTRTCPP